MCTEEEEDLENIFQAMLNDMQRIVCFANHLPASIQQRPKIYIVNTDESGQPGSHWVAFHFPHRGPAELFDSTGHGPEAYHRRFKYVLLANGPHYLYNPSIIQDTRSDTCGQCCLCYAYHRCRG